MKSKTTKKFKNDFKSWCGFDLEGNTVIDIIAEIKSRQWQMECDINNQAKGLINDFKILNNVKDER